MTYNSAVFDLASSNSLFISSEQLTLELLEDEDEDEDPPEELPMIPMFPVEDEEDAEDEQDDEFTEFTPFRTEFVLFKTATAAEFIMRL